MSTTTEASRENLIHHSEALRSLERFAAARLVDIGVADTTQDRTARAEASKLVVAVDEARRAFAALMSAFGIRPT